MVVGIVPVCFALCSGLRLVFGYLDRFVLSVGDSSRTNRERAIQPESEISVFAGHPASETGFEYNVILFACDRTETAIQVTIDLVVLFSEAVQFEWRQIPLVSNRPKNIATGNVLVVQFSGKCLRKRTLATAGRAGDGDQHTLGA